MQEGEASWHIPSVPVALARVSEPVHANARVVHLNLQVAANEQVDRQYARFLSLLREEMPQEKRRSPPP